MRDQWAYLPLSFRPLWIHLSIKQRRLLDKTPTHRPTINMRVKLDDLSPEKRITVQDFKNDITAVFNDLYEEKWDQHKWDQATR